MAKTLEIREFGRGEGGKRDDVYAIKVGTTPQVLFEAPGSPILREKGQIVELEFRKIRRNILVIQEGLIAGQPSLTNSANSVVDILAGESVTIIPFSPSGRPSHIPSSQVTHKKTENI